MSGTTWIGSSGNVATSANFRIIDPGEDGWASEPKLTDAELLLYGEFAGPIRLLGQAAVAARDAFSLVCKHNNDSQLENADEVFKPFVTQAYSLYEDALDAHRRFAATAVALVCERAESHKV